MSGTGGPADILLDLRGLKCPLPVLHTRKALARAAGGTRLIVCCTDPMSAIDIPHLAHETGARLEEKTQAEGVLTFHLVAPGPVSGER